MSDTTTGVGPTPRRRTSTKRLRILPFDDHVAALFRDDPGLFRPYDASILADALVERLFPADLPNLNVIKELIESVLGTFRRKYDPDFARGTSARGKKLAPPVVPDKDELATLVLGAFKSSTVMRDGRPLGEWTWGEFRQEFAGMAAIIGRFSGKPDDELIGDQLD